MIRIRKGQGLPILADNSLESVLHVSLGFVVSFSLNAEYLTITSTILLKWVQTLRNPIESK